MKLKLSFSKEKEQSESPSIPKIKLKASSGQKITLRKPSVEQHLPSSPANNGTPSITLSSNKSKTVLRVKPSREHGDGWDSEDPDREEDPLIEDGIILRMLPDANLHVLRAAADGGDLSGISIFWKDKRRAIVKIHRDMYAAKLMELPTIVDVHKTLDKKNMFKTIDVCQILLITKRIHDEKEILDLYVDKEFGETYPDGITPPMENSKYRFKKKYEQRVVQNIEDEVEKLLRLDAEAESSTYEFINPEEESITMESIIESKLKNKRSKKEKKKRRKEREAENKLSASNQIANSMNIPGHNDEGIDNLDEELDKLMGDVDMEFDIDDEDGDEGGKTSHNEEEDDEEESEDDVDAPENAEVPIHSEGQGSEASSEDEEDEEDDDDLFNDGNNEGGREEVDETKRHNAILMDEIKELETIIEQKKNDLVKIVNPIMKNRINDVIGKLVQELEMKKNQIVEVEGNDSDVEGISNGQGIEDYNEGDDEGEEEDEEEEEEEEDDEEEEDEGQEENSNGNEAQSAIKQDTQAVDDEIEMDEEVTVNNTQADFDTNLKMNIDQEINVLDEDEDEGEEDDFGDLF